jgi:hypothetical protein
MMMTIMTFIEDRLLSSPLQLLGPTTTTVKQLQQQQQQQQQQQHEEYS